MLHDEALKRDLGATIADVEKEVVGLENKETEVLGNAMDLCGKVAAIIYNIRGNGDFGISPQNGVINLPGGIASGLPFGGVFGGVHGEENKQRFFTAFNETIDDNDASLHNQIDRLNIQLDDLKAQAAEKV